MKVTKQEFAAYERVRKSGAYNMLTEGRMAADEAGLSREQYHAVMDNYDECIKKWPSVRKGNVSAAWKVADAGFRGAAAVREKDVETLKDEAVSALEALKDGIVDTPAYINGGNIVKLLRRTKEAIELIERDY